jgi:hypothetical protein
MRRYRLNQHDLAFIYISRETVANASLSGIDLQNCSTLSWTVAPGMVYMEGQMDTGLEQWGELAL